MYVVSVIHGCRRQEGAKWADLVNETVAGIRELGPYLEYQKASDYLEKGGYL